MFSIICPVYNAEKFLPDLFLSLKSQDYRKFEVIFVDDASSDISLKMLKTFAESCDHKVTILKNESNLGAGASRNKALKCSNFSWIAFLDADDIWKPNKLSSCANAIKDNPSANFICHNEMLISKSKEARLLYDNKYRALGYSAKILYLTNYFSTSASVVSKQLIGDVQFDENLRSGQDYDFWLSLGARIRPIFLNEILGMYRMHANNISSSSLFKRYKNELKIARKHRNMFGTPLYILKLIKINLGFARLRIGNLL